MKKNFAAKLLACLLFALPCLFSACVKDHCTVKHTYTYFAPVYKTKEEVRANIKKNASRAIERPGKIYVLGNTIYLNEIDKGIHVIDNSNPAAPRNVGFIDIPGNLDIAIKGTTLYADLYTDLVALDISNASEVKVKKIIEGQFPYRYYGNGFMAQNDKIIADWVRRDTVITESCEKPTDIWKLFDSGAVFLTTQASSSNSSAAASPVGIGGSMARFTIMNDRLYTVSNTHLDVFNIASPNDPQHSNGIQLGWNIETIYPFKNKLFIGSQTGMFVYDVTNPDAPAAAGQFNHARVCDPVVADDNYAYVTLSSGGSCGGFSNQLDIVKLNNLAPTLVKSYPLNNPHGLSKVGNLLFICDGSAGLKLYNVADVMNIQPIRTVSGLDAYDVIARDNTALVVAKDGIYQYNYENLSDIRLLSKLTITRN